jgi:hypothetical protein
MRNAIIDFLRTIARIPSLFLGRGHFWKGVREILRGLCRAFRRCIGAEPKPVPARRGCCIDLPPDVYKRPDPLLYAQYYLMKMGLAVTWDNPDIDLFEVGPGGGLGAPVSSSSLLANHPYKVRVRVWNGSYDAPAVGLPVHLSYLSFGVGTVSHPVASTKVNLGVKGSPNQPAFAILDWKTPPVAGHFCLQAQLEWWDDANPDNNLGQENVTVGQVHSPAEFKFALRNEATVERRFVLEADTYRLPTLAPCDEPPLRDARDGPTNRPLTRLAESRQRWEVARREQGYGRFPVPPEWAVIIDPSELTLAAGVEQEIRVSIEPRSAETTGTFNVHAFSFRGDGARDLVGGVTLLVSKA